MTARVQYRRYRKIADELAARIEAGDYSPGSRLPSERELVDELRVSRPTVREALIALEIMGYVTVKGGSGIYVAEESTHHADVDPGFGSFELLEAREMVETDIAAIAAVTITPDQLSELREQLERQIKGLEEDGVMSEETDMRFHVLIAAATGNGALHYIVQQLWRFRRESHISRLLDERAGMTALQSRAAEEHIRIFAAIEARNAEAARDAMREHIQHNIEWRLRKSNIAAISDKDRRTKLRLLLARSAPHQSVD